MTVNMFIYVFRSRKIKQRHRPELSRDIGTLGGRRSHALGLLVSLPLLAGPLLPDGPLLLLVGQHLLLVGPPIRLFLIVGFQEF